jgi:phospholipid/cholesterol/gamma-HCH transport system substrate-binding protein
MMKSLDLQQFQARLRVVDKMLTEIEQGRNRVGRFVLGDQMYRDLRARIREIEAKVHDAVSTTSAVGRVFYEDTLYRQIREPVIQLDQALARLQSGQGTGGQLLRDSGQHDRLTAGVTDLRNSVAKMRTGDFIASDTRYNDWNRAVGNLIRRVDEFNTSRLLTSTQTYEGLAGYAKELETNVRDFRQSPGKYLRLKLF